MPSSKQFIPRITVPKPDVSKLFTLESGYQRHRKVLKSPPIHEAAAFSLRSRNVLHALSIRETQSARSNILERTVASPPFHSHNVVYTCVPLSHWSPFSFFWANSGRSFPKKVSPQRGNCVNCSQLKPRRASFMNDVIDN